MEPKLGAPQVCPKCGGYNPSGLSLPEQCVWCKKKTTMSRENIDKAINGMTEKNEDYLQTKSRSKKIEPGEEIKNLIDQVFELERRNVELEAENTRLRQFVKDTTDEMECFNTCTPDWHDDLCPVAYPEQAWRQLKEENAALRQRNAKLVEAFTALMEGLKMENIDKAFTSTQSCRMQNN